MYVVVFNTDIYWMYIYFTRKKKGNFKFDLKNLVIYTRLCNMRDSMSVSVVQNKKVMYHYHIPMMHLGKEGGFCNEGLQ